MVAAPSGLNEWTWMSLRRRHDALGAAKCGLKLVITVCQSTTENWMVPERRFEVLN